MPPLHHSCWNFTASCTMRPISACDQAPVFSTELHCLLPHAINLSLRQAVHFVGTSLLPAPCDQSQPATKHSSSVRNFTASCTMRSSSASWTCLLLAIEGLLDHKLPHQGSWTICHCFIRVHGLIEPPTSARSCTSLSSMPLSRRHFTMWPMKLRK